MHQEKRGLATTMVKNMTLYSPVNPLCSSKERLKRKQILIFTNFKFGAEF